MRRHYLSFLGLMSITLIFRALQLHPNTPALYILAASHELDHLSPSAARALLQRGIRLNSENVEMWSEYVKMELGFIESLRRRWDVLGIDVVESGNRKGKDIEKEREMDIDIDGEDHQMELDEKEDVEEEDESARNAIMEGAIVKSVMSSAAQGPFCIHSVPGHCLKIRRRAWVLLSDISKLYPRSICSRHWKL